MTKKTDVRDYATDINTAKVWCPEAESFQYLKVCETGCKKKDRCRTFKDYFEPKLL
jgi:hypothetical protein